MSPQKLGTAEDERTIRNTATEFVNAWNKHDAKQLATCFSPDGDLISPNGHVARGRADVEKLLNEEQSGPFKNSRLNMPQKYLRFLSASLAIADYDFDISHTTGGDIKGLVTSVLRKEGEKWLIAAARPMVPAQHPGTQQH